jgi:hypothetical protein
MPSQWMRSEHAVRHVCAVLRTETGRAKLELAHLASTGRVQTRASFWIVNGLVIGEHKLIPLHWWEQLDDRSGWWDADCLHSYFGIEFDRQSVLEFYAIGNNAPGISAGLTRRGGGAKVRFEWDRVVAEVVRRVHIDGVPSNVRGFTSDLLDWCHGEFGDASPAESTIRDRVTKWLRSAQQEIGE